MIAALLLQVESVEPLPRDVWASVSAHAALSRKSRVVEYIRDADDERDEQYTLRLTIQQSDEPPIVMWASSRTCNGVREAVSRLQTVPFPHVEMPRDDLIITTDGVGYVVQFNATYGSDIEGPMTLHSNIGTPLANWVEGTFAVLRACWSPVRLVVKRKP